MDVGCGMSREQDVDVLARLSEDELKLVRYLIRHSDKNGVAVLNVKGASSELGISEKELRKLAKSLIEKGLISIETQQEIGYLTVDKDFQNLLISRMSQALSRLKDLETDVNYLDEMLKRLGKSIKESNTKLEELAKIIEQVRETVLRALDECLPRISEEFELIKARHLIGELDEDSYRHVEKINASASTLATEIRGFIASAAQSSGELFKSVKKSLDEYANILNALLQENLTRISSNLQQSFETLEEIIENIRKLGG